jgi:hypothetical protein
MTVRSVILANAGIHDFASRHPRLPDADMCSGMDSCLRRNDGKERRNDGQIRHPRERGDP